LVRFRAGLSVWLPPVETVHCGVVGLSFRRGVSLRSGLQLTHTHTFTRRRQAQQTPVWVESSLMIPAPEGRCSLVYCRPAAWKAVNVRFFSATFSDQGQPYQGPLARGSPGKARSVRLLPCNLCCVLRDIWILGLPPYTPSGCLIIYPCCDGRWVSRGVVAGYVIGGFHPAGQGSNRQVADARE
jgi:hypothetical protein